MTGILTLKRGGKRSARMAGVKSKREKYSTSNRDTAKQPTVKKTKTKSYLDTLREQKDRTWEDARSKAASGVEERFRDESDKQFLQQMEDFNRKRIEEESKSGVIDRSDIVGYKDGLFGLNIGATPTGQFIINPDTGRKIFIEKARQGLTSSEYKDWIQNKITNDRMGKQSWERAFPIGSGKVLTGIAELLAPAPLKMASQLWKATTKPVETYENFIKRFGTNTDAKIVDIQKESKMDTDELINKTMDDQYRSYLDNFPPTVANPAETIKTFDEFKSEQIGETDADEIFSDTVYNPKADERERKIQFINQALGTNFEKGDISTDRSLDQTYQHAKQKVGSDIKETNPGQFDLTDRSDSLNLTGTTLEEPNAIDPSHEFVDTYGLEGDRNELRREASKDPTSFSHYGFAGVNRDYYPVNLRPDRKYTFPEANREIGDFASERVAGWGDFQDVETMGPIPLESGIFEYLPLSSGLLDWNLSPERKPETFNTFKDGGYANMSTFEKLKAMAIATADAK